AVLRLRDAIIRGRFIVFRGGIGIDRPALSRLEHLRQKELGVGVAPICRRGQPTPRFFEIPRNPLSEQISRSQSKLTLALPLVGRLSVPVNGLGIVQSTQLLIYEDVA